MAKQTLIWTCLPHGLSPDGKSVRVSVLVSPRLDAEADPPRLVSFGDWLDWPATLSRAVFRFTVGGRPPILTSLRDSTGSTRHDATSGAPDSAVWRALMSQKTPVVVDPTPLALLDSDVLSYSATDVHDLVRDRYVDLAKRCAVELPRIGADLLDDPQWSDLVDAVGQVDAWGRDRDSQLLIGDGAGATHIERRFSVLKTLLNLTPLGSAGTSTVDQARHLARFELFQTPPLRPEPITPRQRDDDPRISCATQEFVRPPLPTAEALEKRMDFHAIIASMNAYPTLQRRLGLVIDFVLDRQVLPEGSNLSLSVEVELRSTTPYGSVLSPVTHVSHDDKGFSAAPRPAANAEEDHLRQGLLDLYSQPDRYAVLQADVDGAGHKLMNFARTLGGYRRRNASDGSALLDDVSRQPKQAGAPALRTAGVMLVRKDRAMALKARFDANRQQAKSVISPHLWAEDLVRGYRIDAWDAKTRVWRSLCRRHAEYRLANGTLVVSPVAGEEEATVQLAATRSPDHTYNPNVLYLHEAMVSWTGWSLAAPPPGKGIGIDDALAAPGGKPEFIDESGALPSLDFRSRFRALPGSMPRLRYGRSYALRARAVDLAGNSLPPTEQDIGPERPALNAQAFLRFEPLAAPALALLRPDRRATELPLEGESMHRLAIRSFNDVYNDPTPSAQVARRYAVPPQSTAKEAELHGELDLAGSLSPATFQMLAIDNDLSAGDAGAALVAEQVPMQGLQDTKPVETVYSVWREGMAMTYLPDPMAERVSAWFIGHPSISPAQTLQIPLYPQGRRWPQAQPFRIELHEDPSNPAAKPVFDSAAHVLRIPLPKGARATLRLAMRPCKHNLLKRMGLWQWLDEQTQSEIVHSALDGRCWLFTPWQDIELVHAVQRPLIIPAIRKLGADRQAKATSATPSFLADCSLPSTDRLDLLARWHEPVDDTRVAVPGDRERHDLAFHIKVTEARDYRADQHALADHTPPSQLGEGPDTIGINSRHQRFIAHKQHEFNDTRYRRIEYQLVATSRYREYLPPALLQEPDASSPGGFKAVSKHLTLEGPRAVTWIKSSAPPPAPKLLYVVPTFGWERMRDDAGGTARSRRRGGGLRVYLDRPWNASGYGEMLAVVLPPANYSGDPDQQPAGAPYKKYVTQWGNDPVWASPFVSGLAPARGHFPRARWQPDPAGAWLPPGALKTEADQTPGAFELRPPRPAGDASGPIEIAPHDVVYDADRQLWCCDIEIDQGPSYWPFVRLALARYQPCSTEGAHLSEIVLADFMPLTADRWLTVTSEAEGRSRRVTLHGAGPARPEIDPVSQQATEIRALSNTSVVEVWLERLEPTLGEDFGWQRVAQGVRSAPSGQRRTGIAVLRSDSMTSPLWEGRVDLPVVDEAARLRLVVAEYEEYPVDGESSFAGEEPVQTGRRLVFVEHVAL